MKNFCKAQRGIAIGPILFIIALLAIIVMAMSSGMGNFGMSTTVDRIKSDVRGQANLIRSKVQECYMTTMGATSFGYPDGPTPSGTKVIDLTCPGDPTGQQNIWTGARPTSLPATPQNFSDWVYFNYNKGRCIRLTPAGAAATQAAVQEGLTQVAKYFGPKEVYLNSSGDWSLSIWLTPLATPIRCGD